MTDQNKRTEYYENMLPAIPPESQRDLRGEVPDIVPFLLPGERVINVDYPEIEPFTDRISVVKALYALTGADDHGSVGENGPAVAAMATDENGDIEALRLFDGVLFGRDALRVALDLLDRYPRLAHATIRELAIWQGTEKKARSGEEPGRILHEKRDPATDKRAQLYTKTHGWEWPYYESIDATPLFISLIKRYCKQETSADILHEPYVAKDGSMSRISDAFTAAVSWLTGRLDENQDGYLEFQRTMGIDPESWRDSWDAFSHRDGTIANLYQPIAGLEVQTLAYDALLDAAQVYRTWLADADRASELTARAHNLKRRILKDFWIDDDERQPSGYFAMGLDYDDDGRRRRLCVRSSDMGHTLNSRLLDGRSDDIVAKREAVIRCIFSDPMLCAAGVRTLAKDETRFRPGGYHTGSSWLWDTYYIAQGLERHGYYGLSEQLKMRIWYVTELTNLLPEFVRGDDELVPRLNTRIIDVWDPQGIDKVWDGAQMRYVVGRQNRIEQPPQEIQAWSVAAILASKFKRDPLHPKHAVPLEAVDNEKRQFEVSILKNIKPVTF